MRAYDDCARLDAEAADDTAAWDARMRAARPAWRPVRQCPGCEGRAHGAIRLALVPTVAEAATLRKIQDFRENRREPLAGVVPKLQFAHPGGVDEQSAGGQRHEFASRGGVLAALVVLAHGRDRLALLAYQAVEQGGLAHAR